jgi:hypothetical protein
MCPMTSLWRETIEGEEIPLTPFTKGGIGERSTRSPIPLYPLYQRGMSNAR